MDTVLRAIPHRPPFLFVGNVLEETEAGILAERTLRVDEAFFAGHYPGNPIMPGVLICEAIFQAAAIYLTHKMEKAGQAVIGKTPVLARIEDARFRRIVRPGETMTIAVTWKETVGHFHFLKGTVKVAGQLAASVQFALAMVGEEGS